MAEVTRMEVEANARPTVTLHPSDFVFVLLSEDDDSARVIVLGRGGATESTARLTSPLTGEIIDCPSWRVNFPDRRIISVKEHSVTLLADDE